MTDLISIRNNGLVEQGLKLASLPESEGGWAEYFSKTCDADLTIEDDMLRAQTAIMLENAKVELMQQAGARFRNGRMVLNEATKAAMVGGFSDYLFPVIRAAFPTNAINDLVSVQPTNRRVATVVYWNWIVGKTKGKHVQGERLFDANVGKQDASFHFSDETVELEPVAALGSEGATYSGTLNWNDGGGVRPGTVQLVLQQKGGATDVTFVDNGNGGFVNASAFNGDGDISTSSINYATGAWSITITGTGDDGLFDDAITTNTATYRWNSEGGTLPEVDVQITTTSTEVERRALKLNWSHEAMQDVMAEFGVSLEPQLITGAAEQINFEIARQIEKAIWDVAPVGGSFSITVPAGVSTEEHFRGLLYQLNIASNNIHSRTQKGYGNWLIVDEGAHAVIATLPRSLFEPAPAPSNPQGLHFIGTLAGTYRVYKDILLNSLPGSAAVGNILMGFKGRNFFEAGFVYSPYQMLYTTQPLETADFLTQRGMATRYATKMVNDGMFERVSLTS